MFPGFSKSIVRPLAGDRRVAMVELLDGLRRDVREGGPHQHGRDRYSAAADSWAGPHH